jgi:hypothetical protein
MKEKDIYIDNKTHEIILYVEKEDESYAPVVSGSYAVNHHLEDFFRMKEVLEKSLMQQWLEGRISPVYYYMVLQDMGPGDLAKRMKITRRKLRKHFIPGVFDRLDEDTLKKYAIIFGVTPEKVINPKETE